MACPTAWNARETPLGRQLPVGDYPSVWDIAQALPNPALECRSIRVEGEGKRLPLTGEIRFQLALCLSEERQVVITAIVPIDQGSQVVVFREQGQRA